MVAYTVEEWIAQGNQITVLDHQPKEIVLSKKASAKNVVKHQKTTVKAQSKTQQLVNNYRAICWRDNDFHRYLGFIDALRALNKIDAEQYQTIYLQWLFEA